MRSFSKRFFANIFEGANVNPILILSIIFPILAFTQGCGKFSLAGGQQPITAPPLAPLSVTPSSATMQVWQSQSFSVSGASDPGSCTWSSSTPAMLANLGGSTYQGTQTGTAQVKVTCASSSATASVSIVSQQTSGPITITSGGTYSGIWNSDDPNTPAVTIHTDQPVILQDSTITSRGRLIDISGVSTGANVTIQNVTGTALDPQVAGLQRGAFVKANHFVSLSVQNCSIYGASFGVLAGGGSTISNLKILNNMASNLEDRASDGNGGLLANRPSLGHFVQFSVLSAPFGAEIAWNQVVQTIGRSSTEDVINIYKSQGASGHPIWVHDNYLEGYSSTTTPQYTGAGITTDGDTSLPVTAYVSIEANEMVHAAGGGIAIANGNNITASANRIVSCGWDSVDGWYAMPYTNAVGMFDFYKTGSALFYNNTITQSQGGMVVPGARGNPVPADTSFSGEAEIGYPGNSVNPNNFTDPCFVQGTLNLEAETAERAYWASKVSAASQLIGDQHLN